MKLCLIWGVILAVLVIPGLSMDATLEDELPALLKLVNDVSQEAKRGGGDVLHHLHCLELHKAGYCKYGLIRNKFCQKTCFLCNIEPLGMQSKAIPDARITASSMWDGNHAPAQGRLNYKPPRGKAGSWSSRHNRVGQWIQVDLKRVTKVAGIATQGRSNANQWVKQYKLQYSSDGKTFNNYEGGKVFTANKDRNSVVKHNLYKPIIARVNLGNIQWFVQVPHILVSKGPTWYKTNRSSPPPAEFHHYSTWSTSWLFLLETVAIVTVNAITMVIFTRTPRLRSRKHVLIASLAVADRFVGLISVPMCVSIIEAYDLPFLFNEAYKTQDALFGLASLFGLAALAIERAYATYFPFKHRTLSKVPYIVGIAVVWASASIEYLCNFIGIH
ncbi:hypothetical protein QZH41_019577 [Actinostola sp. cb2023]|nr:hypothetical protein QZH41_019577 [Actinostola sp. cb2023]